MSEDASCDGARDAADAYSEEGVGVDCTGLYCCLQLKCSSVGEKEGVVEGGRQGRTTHGCIRTMLINCPEYLSKQPSALSIPALRAPFVRRPEDVP